MVAEDYVIVQRLRPFSWQQRKKLGCGSVDKDSRIAYRTLQQQLSLESMQQIRKCDQD